VTFLGKSSPAVAIIKVTIGANEQIFEIADLKVKDNWQFTTTFNNKGVNHPVTIQSSS
jgi:uncharacterized protein (UPF0333 family)